MSDVYGGNRLILGLDTLTLLSNRPLIMYGTGGFGKVAIKKLIQDGRMPAAVCDGDLKKIGQPFESYSVKSFEQILDEYEDFDVLIASDKYYSQILEVVIKYVPRNRISTLHYFDGFDPNNYKAFVEKNEHRLERIYQELCDERSKVVMTKVIEGHLTNKAEYFEEIHTPNQYFNELTQPFNGEYFVDGGAFNGDTLLEFSKVSNGEYGKIICFEPSNEPYKALEVVRRQEFAFDSRIELHQIGLFNKHCCVCFNAENGVGGDKVLSENFGNNTVDVVPLDSYLNDKVTFLKLDIEGSELEALEGAKETILEYKPKLAISVYHKVDDIVTIPEFIMSLGLDYKYYIRHHGSYPCITNETVFYAV